jgi:hypothetical protein
MLLTRVFLIAILLAVFNNVKDAQALTYKLCKSPQQSMSCAVAFEKSRTFKNPLSKQKFFEDGVHIKGNKLKLMPALYVAQPDLDKDGVKEIIVALTEEKEGSKGLFCQSTYKCPHFIIQNRNPDLNKPRLKYFSLIGAAYANGIGLSTDEKIDNYLSLRVYKSNSTKQFHVYQYDQKTDKYHDLGQQEIRG